MIDHIRTRAWAEIDLDVIRGNYNASKEYAAKHGAKLMAVVKANAYGHGDLRVAAALEKDCGAEYFAAATFDEAKSLADSGIKSSILILSEVHPALYTELVLYPNIIPSICRLESAEALSAAAEKCGRMCDYFIALDTGMSRIGFECTTDEKIDLSFAEICRLVKLPGIRLAGVFSHFACADEKDKSSALLQQSRFDRFVKRLEAAGIHPPMLSLCNSAAFTEPEFENKYQLVREGIGIYGLSPSPDVKNVLNHRPAMTFKARITAVKTVDAGFGISYGHTFVTDRKTRVATVPVGYADGYPRLLSGKAGVMIDGKYAPILGRVCMDQMMVDVSDIPTAEIGSIATVLGGVGEVNADRLASLIGTIGYELICAVSPRIPRVYLNE